MKSFFGVIIVLCSSLSVIARADGPPTPPDRNGPVTERGACQSLAESLVAQVAEASFQNPAGFSPKTRKSSQKNVGSAGVETEYTYLIDMEKSDGTILNGSHGGSSTYSVDISFNSLNKSCFVNSIIFSDEP